MELRDIEVFLTLAEELHFARTAERLHVTPSRVSHAIRKLERRIGAPLFERTSRTVRLTEAGERLAQALRPAYAQILDAVDAASASARGAGGTLVLGAMGPQTWMIREALDTFQSSHPDARLVSRDLNVVDPLAPLRAGEVDVAHLWLPMVEPDITVGPTTHTSPVVLVMAASHPYAGRESVCLEDYGDLTFPAHRSTISAATEATFQPARTPAGRRIARGPEVASWDDILKVAAAGQAVAGSAAEAERFYSWPDLVFVPVRDAAPVRWALAWRTDNRNPLIRALADAVPVHPVLAG